MNGLVSSTTGSESRLARVLDEYLASLERGEPLDRAALRAAHPDLAEDLEACLASLDFIRRAAANAPAAIVGNEPIEIEPATGRLGDFRIIREAGRGGMGVVYEAEQLSLGRRVALKVLPFAAALDPRQLQRFRVEAQAAAQLHHTNIVPVFSVGVERGVHYYAMQFIEGRSLAEVIRELRQARDPAAVHTPMEISPGVGSSGRPFFEAVARLGVQAAEALEYAHSLGIIHRDIKPANLLLDTRGTLWVTDFGLARLHDDAGLTMTGDVLGTLRYMSPEQALARRVLIDARTDVYSLGVTLYELLTLRPAFDGRDRQELLRQFAFEEAPPLRRLDPALPRELETIVLKAMSKEPETRYGSSQELADDLRRFLEHRPIKARRRTVLEHAAKWTRRHLAAVAAAVGVLVLMTVGLAVSLILISRERDTAREQQRIALNKSREADDQRRRAYDHARQARKAVDTMYTQVAEKWFFGQFGMGKLEQDFLSEALRFYQDLSPEEKTDPDVRWATARAHFGLAHIQVGRLGPDEAVPNYRRAIDIASRLVAEQPTRAEFQRTLVACSINLGVILAQNGQIQAALDAFQKAVEGSQSLMATEPGRPVHQYYLITSYIDLGGVLDTLARGREAHEVYQRAVAITETALAASPGRPEWRQKQAHLLYNVGAAEVNLGRTAEAVQAFRQQARIFDELLAQQVAASTNKTRGFRDDCASAHYGLGRALHAAGDLRAAQDEYSISLAFWKELVADFAGAAEIYSRVGLAKTQLALAGLTDPERSEGLCAEALSTLEGLAPRSPNNPELCDALVQARQARAGRPTAPIKLRAVFPHVHYEGISTWSDTQPERERPEPSARR
jgi:tetratricopeptide (TPR) repeat protein/tRNA A-37 threonylcarbamoyl transferase component Bud32